jgi:hypothetical protein
MRAAHSRESFGLRAVAPLLAAFAAFFSNSLAVLRSLVAARGVPAVARSIRRSARRTFVLMPVGTTSSGHTVPSKTASSAQRVVPQADGGGVVVVVTVVVVAVVLEVLPGGSVGVLGVVVEVVVVAVAMRYSTRRTAAAASSLS